MASHDQSSFQPSPPVRTSTVDSQMSLGSPPISPTSRSPTEDSFFGAITARMRRTRSRSRSRNTSRARSKSPMIMPPERLPSSTSTHARNNSLPKQSRTASASTTASSTAAKPTRPSLQNDGRTMSGGDPWRGRHSNSWLFNDFSVTGTAKNFLERRKS